MNFQSFTTQLEGLWRQIYPQTDVTLLQTFLTKLQPKNSHHSAKTKTHWYKNAIVYSLYVDLFNETFDGLEEKFDYLKDLGVNCLWLLPILDSPMKDAGFDVRRYDTVRCELLNLSSSASIDERQKRFSKFIHQAHQFGFHIIFDLPFNHTSDEHEWFVQSKKASSTYKDFYIWNEDDKKYADARIIFKGMVDSNWEKCDNHYFFHRFFPFQPDLNYQYPQVLLKMAEILIFWLQQGVDGIRADAIPYLWKSESTSCENLSQTHLIIKFFRKILDFVNPDALLLAEACQPPKEVVKYFGNNDECHAGYHFPLMPQIYKALATQSATPIMETLSEKVTPKINKENQWFTFLRVHDELTLEMVNHEDRETIFNHFCKQPLWNFRKGEGISARLSELMDFDTKKYLLAYSIMLTLPGTPLVYYGDEFGKANDLGFYQQKLTETGYADSRNLVRGKMDWTWINHELKNKNSFHYQVFHQIKKLISIRKTSPVFGGGDIKWMHKTDPNPIDHAILAFVRILNEKKVLMLHNLSNQKKSYICEYNLKNTIDMTGKSIKMEKNNIILDAFSFYWINLA